MKTKLNYEIRAFIPGREDELVSEIASKRMKTVLQSAVKTEEKRKQRLLAEIEQISGREYR